MSPRAGNAHALPLLLIGAVGIAFAPIFVRLSELGPLATAFYRIFLALPVLWLLVLREARRGAAAAPLRGQDLMHLGLAGALFAADLMAWHVAIQLTSVANATLLANFAPVFVTVGGWLLFHERPTGRFLMALALGVAGAAVMMGDSFALDRDHLLGDALGLLTAVFYGGYILTVSRLRRRLATLQVMAGSGLVTVLILLPVAASAEQDMFAVTVYGWAMLAALAWVSHLGGQGLITFALAHLPAAFSSLALLVQPVAAAALAWWLLHEPLRFWQTGGALLVLAAIALARPDRSAGK